MAHPVVYSAATHEHAILAGAACRHPSSGLRSAPSGRQHHGDAQESAQSGSPSRMRCNWLRWLWGIIPVAILSWAAVQAERPRIEQELTEAASAQLLSSGASWAQVTLQGRDAVLAGKAWDEA